MDVSKLTLSPSKRTPEGRVPLAAHKGCFCIDILSSTSGCLQQLTEVLLASGRALP